MSRLSLRTMGCGVLVLIPACVGVLLWLLLRTGPLIERLVSEANAFEGAAHPRPSHVSPPTSGTFAHAVGALMPAVLELPRPAPDSAPAFEEEDEAAAEAWHRVLQALRVSCREVASGKTPLETMPPACRKVLEESREVMRRVLAATHAEVGGLPVGIGSLSRTDSSFQESGLAALARVVELAALESRLLLAEGRPEQAVDTCLDALALSRELSLGGALHGGVLSAESQELTYRPCAAALDAAPLESKRQALARLQRLREGLPPLSALLREESVFHQLSTFGPDLLPPEALARLPSSGRALVASRGGWFYFSSRLGHPLLRRYIWRRNVSMFDAMVALADLPTDERQRAFARIDAGHSLLAGYPGAVSALKYHHELSPLDTQRLQSTALIALVQADVARATQGRWPATLPPDTATWLRLETVSGQEARLIPSDVALAGHALFLTADSVP
ncbi:hypothetical protein JY651_39625 [Pyxidicoccus parkwayensis]|uniref:Uncharacterized protein n=1 Tax=Pyxidicoccus parkwayensis TaxID=2813578 RepID=A0ABX7NR33_9BACT|nr:hypothetical protein [Pyxidicoccus parkwaysis]QSQ21245.1 hypothetical protein JY651_39625 [Pyxidicoccus parkwaysis]